MKVNFKTTDFKKAWTKLKRIKMNRVDTPILNSVHFEVVGNDLALSRTNLEHAMTVFIPCSWPITNANQAKENFILADPVVQSVIDLNGDHVALDTYKLDQEKMICNGSIEIPANDDSNYPYTNWQNQWRGEAVGVAVTTGRELKALATRFKPTVKEADKYYTCRPGFAIVGDNEQVYALATDRACMSKTKIGISKAGTKEFTAPFDIHALNLLKMAFGTRDIVTLSILGDEDKEDHYMLHAWTTTCQICIKQAKDNFPKWKEIYATSKVTGENILSATFGTALFLAALDRQEPIHKMANLGEEKYDYLFLGITPGRCHITTWAGVDCSFECNTAGGIGVIPLAGEKVRNVFNQDKAITSIKFNQTDRDTGPTEEAMEIMQKDDHALLMPMSGDDDHWSNVLNKISNK